MKYIPGILFLIATPLSVWLFVKVDELVGSEILALFSAVGLYVVLALVIGLVFSRKSLRDGLGFQDQVPDRSDRQSKSGQKM